MNWEPIELIADYWIIQNPETMDEYQDPKGDYLMFYTKQQAQKRIDQILKNEKANNE